jgi:predicted N-formylglutamate amidohydrolase
VAAHRLARASRIDHLFFTCEHGGHRIPAEHAARFHGAARELESHRGWDAGALDVALALARRLGAPLRYVTWSRLLVDANRAPSNPRIWSRVTRALEPEVKQRVLERYWQPHRNAVEADIAAAIARRQRVVHVAVHSFVPTLAGETRNADIGLLYDSKRRGETELCKRWQARLHELDPTLRVRRNYPYRGSTDGLTTWLRRLHPQRAYLGIELELNQDSIARPRRRSAALLDRLATSLDALLGDRGP